MSSYDILVIILSVTLAVFLILAIVAAAYIIKLLKKMDKVADTAQASAENIEAITGTIKNVANGSLIASTLSSLFSKFKHQSGAEKEQ